MNQDVGELGLISVAAIIRWIWDIYPANYQLPVDT